MLFRAMLLPALLVTVCGPASAGDVEQRYVTRWNVEPIARLSTGIVRGANAARCRIDEGPSKDLWLDGRLIGTILGKTTWQIPVDRLTPGLYKVTHELRTPEGVQSISSTLRVPQIARNTGAVGGSLCAPEVWPKDLHRPIACDQGLLQFAWDRQNLYVKTDAEHPVEFSLDLLPAAPKYVRRLSVQGTVTLAWRDLFPATPLTGQTLRYRLEGQQTSDWVDLLFVGSGEEQFFGATTVSNGPGGDDQGPPLPLLKAQMDLTGLDLHSVSVTWEKVEPGDPEAGSHQYDWSSLTSNDNLYKNGLVLVNMNLQNHWAQPLKESDPDRYWSLAEAFLYEAARKCAAAGVRHFTLGYNEPEMFARTDSKDYFNTHLTHCADAVRRAVPDAVVLAGRFSSGDPLLIRDFYSRGFRDNFDVLDIHPYTSDSLTGTAMGEIVASHEALATLGMGRKRIFLGEGWGPARELSQVRRTRWDAPVSRDEADFTRQYYQNGYRCLVTARADYSPDWVLGAKYFTLNDNIGGTYWKQSAKPVYNPKGELMGYKIGELQFSPNSKFEPFFCNGGLVDFLGRPKGQWFYDFPPSLPEVRVAASGGPVFVLVGEPCRIEFAVVNANPRPITNLKLGIRDRSGKFTGKLSAQALGPQTLRSLGPGEVWRGSIGVTLDSATPRKIRWALEIEYAYDGERHISDDIVPAEIRDPIDVLPSVGRIVLDSQDPRELTVRVRNNTRNEALVSPVSTATADLVVSPDSKEIRIAGGKEAEFRVSVRRPGQEAGLRKLTLVQGSESYVSAITPLECPKTAQPPKLDGDLSDWPRAQVAHSAIRMGQATEQTERPADDPFPKPPPAEQSAIGGKPGSVTHATDKPMYSFGADAALAWDDSYLYMAVVVEDKTHQQRFTGMDVWKEDSVQIAFDPLNDGNPNARLPGHEMEAGYNADDYELSLALTGAGPEVAVVVSPRGAQNGTAAQAKAAITHTGGLTTYEARIPWGMLHAIEPRPGSRFGFDILVNNFENGRRYTVGWAGGIGSGKYPGLFVPVVLQ